MKPQHPVWTDRQQATIDARSCNILVSAAAGSGKTAVLIERIKTLLLEDRIGADRLLVVTFTKAAASEMKDKLAKSLRRALAEHPDAAVFLRRQLELVYRANISTFHAFALDVIRRYFQLTSVDPGFSICDEAQARLMKEDAADRVFEEAFERNEPDFLGYVARYGGAKGEKELKASLIALYDKIRTMPDPFGWLDHSLQELSGMPQGDQDAPILAEIRQILQSRLREAVSCMAQATELLEDEGLRILAAKCREDMERTALAAAELAVAPLEQASDLLDGIAWQTLRAGKEEAEAYGQVKEAVAALRDRSKDIVRKELKQKFFGVPLAESLEDLKAVHGQGTVLRELLWAFHLAYGRLKSEKKLLDFSDIEHTAVEILKHPEAAAEFREKFIYIFIDEYQDSNLIQEEIIRLICRENNVFMVGDIKQSIYKFRLAEPEIFQRKYERFKDPDQTQNKKIDLNRNFRSKEPIVAAVNGLFQNLMAYDEDARLHRGVPEVPAHEYPVELCLVQGTDGEGTGDALIEDMKLVELEARAAARLVAESVGLPIFDFKEGRVRPLEKRDIVILMQGIKGRGAFFYKALQEAGIDAYIDDHGGYFDTLEIMTLLDLLRIIDNFRQDLPLLGTLRSAFFDFELSDLCEIRLACPGGPFHHALRQYAASVPESRTGLKCRSFLTQIHGWKEAAVTTPIDELAWKLMTETGYYATMGALPGGGQRQANLQLFVERAAAFRLGGDGSIHGLLRYIRALSEKEVETGQASMLGENEDAVRIMTIHKSKGLEFPMVLLASLGRRFVFDRLEKTGVFHKDLGIGLTRVEADGGWYRHTLLQQCIMYKKRREELAEAVRVLYVAMTRPMDRLVLLAAVKDWEKESVAYETGSKGESNYLGMLVPHLDAAGIRLRPLDPAVYLASGPEGQAVPGFWPEGEGETGQNPDRALRSLVAERLSYVYPHGEALVKKSKYSVTELYESGHVFLPELKRPGFMDKESRLTAADAGNALHLLMQHAELGRLSEPGYPGTFLRSLVDGEYLTDEEAALVDLEAVKDFGRSPLGLRLANASRCFREQPFNRRMDVSGVEVIVQGIIDCWFEDDRGLVLLDYKTGRERPDMDPRYKEQIRIYRDALAEAEGRPVDEVYLCHIPGRKAYPVLL